MERKRFIKSDELSLSTGCWWISVCVNLRPRDDRQAADAICWYRAITESAPNRWQGHHEIVTSRCSSQWSTALAAYQVITLLLCHYTRYDWVVIDYLLVPGHDTSCYIVEIKRHNPSVTFEWYQKGYNELACVAVSDTMWHILNKSNEEVCGHWWNDSRKGMCYWWIIIGRVG